MCYEFSNVLHKQLPNNFLTFKRSHGVETTAHVPFSTVTNLSCIIFICSAGQSVIEL